MTARTDAVIVCSLPLMPCIRLLYILDLKLKVQNVCIQIVNWLKVKRLERINIDNVLELNEVRDPSLGAGQIRVVSQGGRVSRAMEGGS